MNASTTATIVTALFTAAECGHWFKPNHPSGDAEQSLEAQRFSNVLWLGVETLPYLFRRPSLDDTQVTGPMTSGNLVTFIVDGAQYRERLLGQIAGARESIWIDVFEWQSEATGTEIADAVIAAKKRGVDVRIIVDNRHGSGDFGGGSPVDTDALMQRMRDEGCEVRAVTYSGYRVNHTKLMVFDGREALVVGGNIGGNYLYPLSAGWTYHDAGVALAGPAVADVAAVFIAAHARTGGAGLTMPATPAPAGDVELQVLAHLGGSDRVIERALVDEIEAAQRRVVLANGFGMSHAIRSALIAARGRGVAVSWLWGSASHDASLMALASFETLRDAGVELRRYAQPLHMKAYLFDDTLVIGSANLDGFSCWLNDETSVRIRSAAVAEAFYQRVLSDDLVGSAPLGDDAVSSSGARDDVVRYILEPLIDRE